jgi:uncharacterized protein YdhG (YjbR/CyaY superfamily)
MKTYKDVDEYISCFAADVQQKLQQIRLAISNLVPAAEETLCYGIPTFTLYGNLVHYAAYKNHIGFYPGASGIETFKNKLSGYKFSKGTVQFPINEPVPFDLILEIVLFRVNQNQLKAQVKKRVGKKKL